MAKIHALDNAKVGPKAVLASVLETVDDTDNVVIVVVKSDSTDIHWSWMPTPVLAFASVALQHEAMVQVAHGEA
jgi:hypothetical protein